ncbi:hypothetical protein F4825DRAFT_463988 [Nemania diffusa]|nr:hypothetical protein F4825DRAFT_463988 [Nemania diffusa]
MSASAVTLQQVQEDPSRKDIFGVLNQYIQPESATPAAQVAASFAQGVETPNEAFFWGFWNDVFSVAEQIPHSHPAQDRLVAFVRELALVPETAEKVWEANVWTDLPILGAAIRERLDRQLTTPARVSFHAFVARLLHAGVSPGSETTAIWMLRAALEQQDEQVGDDLDRDLMTAAKLALQPEPELDDAQTRMLKGGALWTGKSGLSRDRWAFWGRRFRKLGGKANSQEAKELALHAARLIEVWTHTRLST